MMSHCPTCGNILISDDLGPLRMDQVFRQAFWKDMPVKVSPTQFNVLKIIVENAGKPVTKKHIYEKVFSTSASPSNVIMTILSLRKAFRDVDSAFDKLVTIKGAGYTWDFK